MSLEGKKFKLKNSYFEVFNTNGGSTTNNESLVLLTHGKDKIFMGDVEEEVEYEILNKMPRCRPIKDCRSCLAW